MKTQIIQLDTYDDTISVKDKLGWSQTGRVVLVWPPRGHILDRQLDLLLILRHSQALGVQIALVTNDPEVRLQANLLEIPVYRSIRNAQKSRWRRPRRKTFSLLPQQRNWQERLDEVGKIIDDPPHRKRQARVLSQPLRIGLFTLAVLSVLSIAAVLIPSAQISITPETKFQDIVLEIKANDSTEKINLSGVLPVRWIETTVEGRSSSPATGSISIPLNYATGEILFENLTDQSLVIPAGTVVSTSDSAQRFSTQEEAQLSPEIGSEVAVPIQALSPGSSGNLSPGRIVAVEGNLGVFVEVNNLQPTSGGGMAVSPAPSGSDRAQLREQLVATLTQNARQEIQASLHPQDLLLTQSLRLAGVLSEAYSPPELQPASEVELILRLAFEAPYVSNEDSQIFAKAILEANLPADYSAIPGTMKIEHLDQPLYEQGSTNTWRIHISQEIRNIPSTDQAISLIRGRPPEIANQLLMENLSLASQPHIRTMPSWWPILPLIPIRIEVIETDQVQASHPASPGSLE